MAPPAPHEPVPAPSLACPARRARLEPTFLLDPESSPRVAASLAAEPILSKKLYVGNLTYNVNESDLEALF